MKELEATAAFFGALGAPARIVTKAEFEREAFASPEQFGALHEPVGFGLNPLAYCLGLANAAERRGARLHARSRVTGWRNESGSHRLVTASGTVTAKRVILATGGWQPDDLHPAFRGRLVPALSNIIATRPLSADELAAQSWRTEAPAANTRALLAYLRMTPDKRLLFGGRGDTTGSPAGGRGMKRSLRRYLARLFPAWRDVEITHTWRGFISATMRLSPAVGELRDDPSVSFAFGCHGNGVALMSWAGRELAHRIAGTAGDLPTPMRGLPRQVPLPSLRLWHLRAMLARAWVEDAL
jgi:glycine/D-amino acid oxidase-like deaminating enzyme